MLRSRKNKGGGSNRKLHPSIIATDMNILGNLISEGAVDIDGRIEGNVKAENVTIRDGGKVHGDVTADLAQIYGQVCGIIRAREVHLFNGCHVEGTIMHELLSVEDGAFVDGKFKRSDKINISSHSDDDALSEEEISESKHQETLNMIENIRLISNKPE